MNYKIIFNVLGKTMLLLSVPLLVPLLVGLLYGEYNFEWFVIPMAILLGLGLIFCFVRPTERIIHAKEGFFIVAFVWIIFSAVGCLPFVLSGYIPNYVDALFETASGLSTTGATVMQDVSILPKGLQFWRMLTHWLGGMGVLVFVLAIIPNSQGIMHVFRAESPGPSVGKFVGKMKRTAQILYGIYILLTLLQALMFLLGGMPLYDSIVYSFSIAGTGGFGITNDGLLAYNSLYIEMVAAVFMMLFGTNFNVFYFLLIGNLSKSLKNEEVWWYLGIVFTFTLTIAINIMSMLSGFGEALRYSFFQVTSISSTTGLSTADFDTWPQLSKTLLMMLTVMGACGGSTGGGMKVSRILILVKSAFAEAKTLFHPHTVVKPTLTKETVDDVTVRNVKLYFLIWIGIVVSTTFILSFDSFGDLFSNFSATLACVGNVGPGFSKVGPSCNYSGYNAVSKIVLSFVMLTGRLEIFPMLIFFNPKIWIPKKS